jgi:hypothetical protein
LTGANLLEQKLYGMNNFATMCAIITGLNSVWVDAAMKRFWPNVGMWEVRLLKDLKWFTSSTDNFRFMRDAIVTATHDAPGTASDRGSEMLVGCVPFLGECHVVLGRLVANAVHRNIPF